MSDFNPDQSEEELADEIDNAVPSRGYQMLPVVGLGASAGGVEALRTFFASTPADSGLAFVVVTHLSPEHESLLPEILQRETRMRVVQVSETVRVEADTVYVIPPRKALRTLNGHLQLTDLPQERFRHVAVDLFFRTLADTHGPHATAIVLSGADGDGAIGIKRIKERGGLTIAQDPDEAESSGMPRSAIATGMVDWVLRVEHISQHVLQYYRMERAVRLPPEGPADRAALHTEAADEADLKEVLSFLRSRTGRDFSSYKRATIVRRIGRRMQVNNVHALAEYLDCLRTRPGESGALLQDLLISVTNFFRDPESFASLEEQVPRLFMGKSSADIVRVWIAGCATGEEAYSIAMLLSEHARTLDSPPSIQVFGTDLDDSAIRVAREGVYPTTIEADVTEDRLRRFFTKEHRGFRVRRELRETVLFAVHDVLRDSPFSRLDLVSCRNLLIYLGREAQLRVLDTFHFALLPGALMFLGSSESVEEGRNQFSVVDKKHRVYTQNMAPRAGLPIPSGPNTLALAVEAQVNARGGPVVPLGTVARMGGEAMLRGAALQVEGRTVSWAELHLNLVEHLAPPSMLVDANHEIIHMSPSAGRFLRFSGGEPTKNILRLIHPSVRIELHSALYEATANRQRVMVPPTRLDDDTHFLSIEVCPMDGIAPGLTLILLRAGDHDFALNGDANTPAEPSASSEETQARLANQLDREVLRLKDRLRDTVEQYEVSTEELKASNEELQAMNEELRSATEELETSREELQSINEELTTVNHELKSKVDQLGHSNSDMQNLMNATAIATVFLDRNLAITRYTPSAIVLFNLIPTDVGRPLVHLHTPLEYPDLAHDATTVLTQLIPIEREIAASTDMWYLVRLLPYRTLEDRIAGVVLTFVDITDRKRGREALRRSEERFSAIVDQASVGVVQANFDGKITFANRFYARLLGYGDDELLGQTLLSLVHPDDRSVSESLMERLVDVGAPFDVEKRVLCKNGLFIWLHHSVSPLANMTGVHTSLLLVCNDISERKNAEDSLLETAEQLRTALSENERARRDLEATDEAKDRFLAVLSHEFRNPLGAISAASTALSNASLPEKERSLAAQIVERQTLTLKVLLDDLLDVSSLSLGRVQLQRQPVALASIVEVSLEATLSVMNTSKHTVTVELAENALMVDVDPVRLSQVVANLLMNAGKYTPSGGKISVKAWAQNQRAILQVVDNGIGMNPSTIDTMFEMFSQSTESHSRHGSQGLGIGLALVKSIVEMHGGTVRGESEGDGKGSCFTIELPLAEARSAPVLPSKGSTHQTATTSQVLRVLIADDNTDAVWALSKLLDHYDVTTASNGVEALKLARELRPDVAMLDLGMPGLTGLEVAQAIRSEQWGEEVLLIAATGWGQATDRARAKTAGFNEHLVKPIELSEFEQILKRRFEAK